MAHYQTHGFSAVIFDVGYVDKKNFLVLNLPDLSPLMKAAILNVYGSKVHGIFNFKNVLHMPLPAEVFTFTQNYLVDVIEKQYGKIAGVS
jgi:hypothetical protein